MQKRTTRRGPWLTAMAMVAAAWVAAGVGMAGDDDAPGAAPAVAAAPPADRFVVHEWGTFTSVQGTDGVVLEGLSRDEEELPDFVYDRREIRDCPLRAQGWKGLEVPAEHVTQKMETPIIYFHSATERRVRVRVDFVNGLISQWYPVSDLLGPPEGARDAGPIDVSKIERSFLEWDLDVLPEGAKTRPSQVPAVAPDDPWAFAREVKASWVRTRPRDQPERDGPVEAERYLFYRGLGNFEVPLRAGMWQEDAVVVSNRGDTAMEGAIAFEIRGDRGRVTPVDRLEAGKAAKVILRGGERWGPVDDVARKLEAMVHERLVQRGLEDDEARAMVRTWSRSWFRSEGTRVLWFVPRATIDAILPLSIDPQPDAVVRVLVGRAEVIAPSVAAEVEAAIRDWRSDDETAAQAAVARLHRLGRLVEPHVRNVLAGTKDDVVRKKAEAILARLREHGDV